MDDGFAALNALLAQREEKRKVGENAEQVRTAVVAEKKSGWSILGRRKVVEKEEEEEEEEEEEDDEDDDGIIPTQEGGGDDDGEEEEEEEMEVLEETKKRKGSLLSRLSPLKWFKSGDKGEKILPPAQRSTPVTNTTATNITDDDDFNDDVPYQANNNSPNVVGSSKLGLFTETETKALIDGVDEFGKGNWTKIRNNYPDLLGRTTINLKDKYRNLESSDNKRILATFKPKISYAFVEEHFERERSKR